MYFSRTKNWKTGRIFKYNRKRWFTFKHISYTYTSFRTVNIYKNKIYKYIFVVQIDLFTKFVWLYATKTTNAVDIINKLKKQSVIFGNPQRIISDRSAVFTLKEFKEYCLQENIKHVLITTGVWRVNSQIERVNRVLIPLLTELAKPKYEEWLKIRRFSSSAFKFFHA